MFASSQVQAKGLDISRDTITDCVRPVGLIVNANLSIGDVWSAVRMRLLRHGE